METARDDALVMILIKAMRLKFIRFLQFLRFFRFLRLPRRRKWTIVGRSAPKVLFRTVLISRKWLIRRR
jgi:hypothetical protein